MSDNPKGAQKEMDKAIFISADCWLKVFDLLPRFQLGFGIALISRRFDRRVDEHFKTRKCALDTLQIWSKIAENGAIEMDIVNSKGKTVPNPHYPLPTKVIGFRSISIHFFNHNVCTFLRRFDRFFATCATQIHILTTNVRISAFVVRTIWPMLKDTIRLMSFTTIAFRQMRQLAPSMLNDCSAPRVVAFDKHFLPEFPPDDSANASDGQAVAKWLFSPRPDNLMKVFYGGIENSQSAVDQMLATLEQIKAAFSAASSPVAFNFLIDCPPSSAVVPFELINELTGEKLKLSKSAKGLNVLRCPIAADDEAKMMKEMYELMRGQKNNQIEIFIKRSDGVDNGLLDSSPGPSGH